LLWELHLRYPKPKKIPVILDHYSIHSTEQVGQSLATGAGRRIQLHFLPPYCPDHNRIERTWQDLYANVTRNHAYSNIADLMRQVRAYLNRRNKKSTAECALAA
jgi:transposase